jgi:hypothetical protein
MSLLEVGLRPIITEIESVTLETWQEREKHWISVYKAQLTNLTDGGEGLINPSEDVKRRISEKNSVLLKGNQYRKGIPHTIESKAAISAGLKNSEKFKTGVSNRVQCQHTEENRIKMSNATKGILKTQDHEKNISGSMLNSEKVAEYAKNRIGKKMPPSASEKKIGRKWITNGTEIKQLDKNAPVPEGWVYGMKIK